MNNNIMSSYKDVAFHLVLTLVIIQVVISIVEAKSVSNVFVTVTNRELLSLHIERKSLDFSLVDPENGEFQITNAIRLHIKSNVNWILTAEPMDDLIDAKGNKIPISQLQWRTQSNEYQPFSKNNPCVIARGHPTNGTDIFCDYKLVVNWEDVAGVYTTMISYTLSKAFEEAVMYSEDYRLRNVKNNSSSTKRGGKRKEVKKGGR